MTNEQEPLTPQSLDRSDTMRVSLVPELDRAALNALTERAQEPQTYFGRGLELSDYDREQLAIVATTADKILEPSYSDPDWKAFEDLVKEGSDKGILRSFTTHKGTNIPTWCIDGGRKTTVKKIRTDADQVAIEVPSRIFNLYHWTNTVESIKNYAVSSNETLRGRDTKNLGRNLQQLAQLIGKPDTE